MDDRILAWHRHVKRMQPYNLGFPGATDVDHSSLAPGLTTLLNNVGDPADDGLAANHSKAFEREVVGFVADLLRAPAEDRWGYVTTGGTEGNLAALWAARRRYPYGVVYCSTAVHYSIGKALDLLGMAGVLVDTDERGEMDYDDLAIQIRGFLHQPAIVVANIGTTMTEAVDDVRRIRAVLARAGHDEVWIHADAALAGVPLATLSPQLRPGFDFVDGADSVSVSGHKFLGVPHPCGVLVMRDSLRRANRDVVRYTGSADTTVTGSRSGHTPLMLWRTFQLLGVDGLRARAEQARELATYTADQLIAMDWPAWRHPHAFTVVLRTPPTAIARRWVLPGDRDGWSHLICMPGVTYFQIDGFLRVFAAATGRVDLFMVSGSRRYLRDGGAAVSTPGGVGFDETAWREAARRRWPRYAKLADLLGQELCDPDTGVVDLPRSTVRRIAERTGMLPAAQRAALDQLAGTRLVTRIRSGDGTNLGAYQLHNTPTTPTSVAGERQAEWTAATPTSGAKPPSTPSPPGNTADAGTNPQAATATGRTRWRPARRGTSTSRRGHGTSAS